MGIKSKILTPAIVLIVVVAVAVLMSNIVLFGDFVERSTLIQVDTATKVAVSNLNFLKAEANAASLSIAKDTIIIDGIINNNRDGLLVRARILQNNAGVEFCTITDAMGKVILRTHEPESYGDSLVSQANIQTAMYGETMTTIEAGNIVRLSVRSSTPIFDDNGSIIGVISAGYRLDTNKFVDTVKALTGCELSVVLGDTRLSTTINQRDGTRAVGTKADPMILETVLAGNPYSGRIDILGRATFCNYVPILGADGRAIGMMFIGQYLDEGRETIIAFLQSGLIITLFMLAIAIVSILIVVNRIVKPIEFMAKAASALAVGNTELDIQVNTNDEIRILADAFNSIIANTKQQIQKIESIADGDLTVSLQPRSDKDVMNYILEKLNLTIKAQAATLKEEYERVRLMLDATPLASRIWSRELKLIDCNREAVRLFGLANKKEYIDQYFDTIPEYQPDGQKSKDKAIALIEAAFNNGRSKDKFTYAMKDGSLMPAELIMVRIPLGGSEVVASYIHDLREQVEMTSKLEQALVHAEDANKAKSDFLATMSHEMRTPLNAIIGLSEITLTNEEMCQETKSSIEKIYNAGATLLSIVNDILDISKIQSGKFIITPHEYDVPSLLNDAMLQNILRIGSKPIRFILDINENMPARLYGDELRIKQIINNLLSNAFKYTEEGYVELGFSCESRQNDDSVYITIRVRDSGIGIQKENLQRIFDDYEQVGTTKEQVGGTGLGLAIVKKLTELMGGSLSAESTYGKGSEFTVRLCQGYISDVVLGKNIVKDLKSLQYSANKLNRNANRKCVQLPYARVLLVDDNITNLDVGKGLMKRYAMQIDCVTSGQEAIDIIRDARVKYSAIFMDHMMPNMDGVEATKIIREYDSTIPIIALTANAVVGSEDMFLNNGFQAFLSKPINMEKLDQIINRWVRDKTLEEELFYISNQPKEQPPELPAIDGLDVGAALERFGDKDTLVSVLSSYLTNTPPLLNRLGDGIRTGNYKDYATTVHGIKGSSYSIGANEVGKLAESLENLAKADDFDGIKVLHTALEAQVEMLLDNIEKLLDNIDTIVPVVNKDYQYFTAPKAEILVVEDNETSRKAIIGQLKPLKMRIDTASNGKEALQMLNDKHYHLIFMDYMMPIMDGMESVIKLRQMEEEYFRTVPVIALTAHDDIKESLLQAGCNDFLKKPVEMEEIYEKIKRWLPSELLYEQASAWTPPIDQDNLPAIEGINSQDGVHYSGTKELFISLLGDFYNSIDIKANKLEQYLTDDMLRDLTIEAHALRNTAKTIGAGELSDAFSRLEQCGNEGDREALALIMPEILKQYKRFKPLLKSFGEITEQEKIFAPKEEIISLLQALVTAIDSFDIDRADMVFKQLSNVQIPIECRTHMQVLGVYMADVAMENIVKSAETMIKILSESIA